MKNARGNALFLILIAVALFAALSYAVTQSDRGGRGITREAELIMAARITQFSNDVSVAATRMVLTGTAASNVEFCSPADGLCIWGINGAVFGEDCSSGVDCVTAPDGGGAIAYTGLDFDLLNTGVGYDAVTRAVTDVGTTANDGILMVTVTQGLCEALNDGLGLATPPTDSDGDVGELSAFPGEYVACFQDDDIAGDPYYYYHVMIAN